MNVSSKSHPRFASRAGLGTAALALAMGSLANAALGETRGTATIHFPFLAGTTRCPAGSYDFEVDGTKVTLRSKDPKGPAVVLLVLTRLGRHDRDKGPEFVFDKVDEEMKISEIWPADEDGYLMLLTSGPHGHRVVGGSNAHD